MDSSPRGSTDMGVSHCPFRVLSFPGGVWHLALMSSCEKDSPCLAKASAHLSLDTSWCDWHAGVHLSCDKQSLCKYYHFKANPTKSSLIAVLPRPQAPPPVMEKKKKWNNGKHTRCLGKMSPLQEPGSEVWELPRGPGRSKASMQGLGLFSLLLQASVSQM